MGDAEKQRIVMQISSVQTEIKRTMDERDLKLKEATLSRLEEIQSEVKLESKQRLENEKEARLAIESVDNKMKLYTDETTESVRVILSVSMTSFFATLLNRHKGLSHLIKHPSKIPFKAPFKNRFFETRYTYPPSGALTNALRISVSCLKETAHKGYLKGGLRRVS